MLKNLLISGAFGALLIGTAIAGGSTPTSKAADSCCAPKVQMSCCGSECCDEACMKACQAAGACTDTCKTNCDDHCGGGCCGSKA